MKLMLQNRYQVTFDREPETLTSALKMRAVHFGANDDDIFDAACTHVLIEDMQTRDLVCTFRFQYFNSGADIAHSYGAQYYDLSNLARFSKPIMEIGRFCVNMDHIDPMSCASHGHQSRIMWMQMISVFCAVAHHFRAMILPHTKTHLRC